MNKEEIFLKDHIGNHTPFKVPEGYFDSLTDRIMERVVEQPALRVVKIETPFYTQMRFWFAAAVCVLVLGFSGVLYLNRPALESETIILAQQDGNDSYFDDAADYVMLDNSDIYACLMND